MAGGWYDTLCELVVFPGVKDDGSIIPSLSLINLETFSIFTIHIRYQKTYCYSCSLVTVHNEHHQGLSPAHLTNSTPFCKLYLLY